MKYLVIVEETAAGFSAYLPDLPGCVAAAATREEAEQLIAGAVPFHIDSMRADGLSVPAPQSSSTYVEVDA